MDSGPETIERPLVAKSAERLRSELRATTRAVPEIARWSRPADVRPASVGRVTVLIPTYNRGPMLSECLASIFHQSMPPHQVIVIDDGSTDDTEARVAKFGPRVQYLYQTNRGKASALNAALPLITGEFVWVFDDDDVALPTSIADRVAALDANPQAEVVFSRHYWGSSGDDGRIERRELAQWPTLEKEDLFLALMRGCFTTLQGALTRTPSFRRMGPFRTDLLRSQDYEALIRLARFCNVMLLDRPTFVFRRHDGPRGPESIRHSESAKAQYWARYDAMIGEGLRRELQLGEYLTPPVFGPLSPEQTRDALFNRMSVMASKGLAEPFIEDAIAFADACKADRLTPAQRIAAIESVQQRYFQLGVVARPAELLRMVPRLAARPVGRPLLRAFARGLLGFARWGTNSWRQRVATLNLTARLAWLGMAPVARSE